MPIDHDPVFLARSVRSVHRAPEQGAGCRWTRGAGAGERVHPLVGFSLAVLREPRPGHRDLLLRLAELMFVELLSRHIASLGPAQTGWLAGLRGPLVARLLGLLHAAPCRRWTLETLAREAGASRTVAAERFAKVVGQPPMRYLAHWRMQLAARMLAQPGAKVVSAAQAVGFDSEAAFSRAFKRSTGVAPARWRRQTQA